VGLSSTEPLSSTPQHRASIEQGFTEVWDDYSQRAESNKRRYKFHRLLSRPVLHISWVMLLLALGVVFAPETRVTEAVPYLVPVFSGVAFLFALWQMACGYRESWITYRTATEHLRQAFFRYRTGLHPFAGPDAPRELERELARVNKFVHETNESPPGPVVTLWRLWHMKSPVERHTESTGKGGSHPRAPGTGLDYSDGESFLSFFIRDQQLWHYRKAKTYLWRFIALQALILAASGLGMWLSWKIGPEIWIMGVLGAANILMIYIGDFFDLSALFQRYYYVVSELRRLGHEYRVGEGPFAGLSDDEQRTRLAAEVDHVLAREFDYWHARAGKSPKERPASAADLAAPNLATPSVS
jgi:hypothetical protein